MSEQRHRARHTIRVSYTTFDFSNMPYDFMCGDVNISYLNGIIAQLDQDTQPQNDIDGVYGDWCALVKGELYNSILTNI